MPGRAKRGVSGRLRSEHSTRSPDPAEQLHRTQSRFHVENRHRDDQLVRLGEIEKRLDLSADRLGAPTTA